MLPSSPPEQGNIQPPHPLALALIERMRMRPGATILELGGGSARNARALLQAGFAVTTIGGDCTMPSGPFAAALSTHAFLHGMPPDLAAMLLAVARVLETGAPLYATFGSTSDARFARGRGLGENTFAPTEGDERGVPHHFFDERRLRAILGASFVVESLTEVGVDRIAGSWAHANAPLSGSVHWFAKAVRAPERYAS